MVGNTVIIVILLAVGFQVIRLHIKLDKKLNEITETLKRIEKSESKRAE